MAHYNIREFQQKDGNEINELFNSVFSTKRTLEEWSHKFFGHPNAELKSIIVLALHEGQLVGTYASVPYVISYGGKFLPVLQALDNCIFEAHRGMGIQSKMYSVINSLASRESYCLGFGFPGGKALDIGLGRLGYKVICKLERWVMSLDKIQQLCFTSDTIEVSATDLSLQLPLSTRQSKLHIQKTTAYLKWRYACRKDIRFRIFAKFKNEVLQSYIVYGFKKIYPQSVIIYDIEYLNDDSALEVLQSSFFQLKEDGFKDIVAYIKNHEKEEFILKLVGFTCYPEKYINVVVGEIWQDDIPKDVIFNQRNWYISLGDSDL